MHDFSLDSPVGNNKVNHFKIFRKAALQMFHKEGNAHNACVRASAESNRFTLGDSYSTCMEVVPLLPPTVPASVPECL